jgi:RecJ-like exonuclease
VKLEVVFEWITMTLEYRAVLDIDGACEAVRESVDCPSCKGEKKTIFEKVCRSCEGTGKVWRIILVNEVSRRTD